ncbi:hypothetical protein ACFVYR_03060 [Streptomyces sp. NPDC058284]|uniref:hypothetical protein n=1 Tax=unclassified Streptomyces TaxID=2593676 RepID=UPI0036626A9C
MRIRTSAGVLAACALLLAAGCSGGDGGSDSVREPSKPSSPTGPVRKGEGVSQKDDPNLLHGFRTWLRTNDSKRDDSLADHALNVSLGYRSGDRHGVVDVLTDYGPWGEAEDQVGPLAEAFTRWWDEDPAAGSARFLGQGGKTAKKATLYEGGKPSNLLDDFRAWTTANAPDGKRLAPHVTALTIGYGRKGAGAVTVSTDYLTHKDDDAQNNVDALGKAFADWWDGDEGAASVTVTSEDQGSHAERKLH